MPKLVHDCADGAPSVLSFHDYWVSMIQFQQPTTCVKAINSNQTATLTMLGQIKTRVHQKHQRVVQQAT
jgi:hypothetical protein